MNKISKKIVSLVTMAAFALTLVPAAAFAQAGQVDGSTVTVNPVSENSATVTVDVSATDASELAGGNIVVWATDEDGVVPQTEVRYTPVAGTTVASGFSNWNEAVVLTAPTNAGKVAVTAQFTQVGDYVLHAALNEPHGTPAQTAQDLTEVQEIGAGTSFNFADRSKSLYGVIKDNKVQDTASVNINKDLTTSFMINDGGSKATIAPLANVVIWAIDSKTGDPSSCLVVDGATKVAGNYAYSLGDVTNLQDVDIQFTTGGEYTIYAGVGATYDAAKDNKLVGATKVKVTDTTEIDSLTLKDEAGNALPYDKESNTFTLDLTKDAVKGDFVFGGSDVYTINGTAFDGKDEALNQELTFSTENTDIVEFVDADKTVNTGNTGTFKLEFSMQDKKNAVITITDSKTGDEYNVRIIATKTTAKDIDRSKTGGYVIASTDDQFAANINRNLADAVQFVITDEKTDAVTGWDAIAGEPAANKNDTDHEKYLRVMERADGSNLVADDLELVNDGDHYTLKYVGATNDADKLVPGKYQVRVTLLSGDNATVTFTAAEFGKVVDMEIELEAWNGSDLQQKPTDPGYTVDDEVTLGQIVVATATYVDGNGIKVAADGSTIDFGFDGKAVRDVNEANAIFGTAYDTPANESLLGTTIKVTAFDRVNKQLIKKELTVVDSYNTYSLEFDPTEGPINEDNKVTVTVVDQDGEKAKISNGTVKAYIADKSDADAKVSVKAGNFSNGKATLTVYSDRETTADVVVMVKAGSAIYPATLEYTFGTADPLADRTVVMTIDSTEYVVNNNVITGDAAPYVDSNWRTMVPIRALAEAFDAEVIWNQDDSTVTINFDGDTQIVMTVDEQTYTVNGAEATMDTEPVNAGDRVYVPIRFAAEGLGFSVTPLYNDAGLTASVVFQR